MDQLSKTPTAPNKAEIQETVELLLDAFAAPRKDRQPTALSVSEIANDLKDRLPPAPNIGPVNTMLKHMNPRKAAGVDGVPSWLLEQFHEEFAPDVHDIICASIEQSKYPTSYKHALVSLVPKVDNPTDINNGFRHLSVLPQVTKALERIQLKLNLKYPSLNASQHASTEDRSTMTALASITQDWYNATDSGNP
ncbi:uncharacterized protein LOC111336477 [Stylophora pistillata]|uniref:uncharacterized protein LOC111336477 n=1 Tax=Stylophora pistillata TaxID=50429 RepID=UPI000C0467FD|nr:uncharacterized protein LOC111336477 [Stylophora pistillata]